MLILVINSGSSSIKFQLFNHKKSAFTILAKGQAEAINLPNSQFSLTSSKITHTLSIPIPSHASAIHLIMTELQKSGLITNRDPISLIGHRVVHGGEKYSQPVIITPKVLKEIKSLCALAPLHNPANLACIEACQKTFPKIKQVAVFDTAFHSSIAPEAYLYAIPTDLHQKHGIRRYGFHGTNHQYIGREAAKLLRNKKFPHQKIITVHLGNGCSITAIKNTRSIATSMGYTPLEGLVMGTRSGDIDSALIPVLAEKLKLTTSEVINFLNKKSGLLGLSGLSSDMRTIWAAARRRNPAALLSMDIYARRIAQYINAYIGFLGGIDAIVFTGGIGENAYYIRKRVCNYLKHLQISLDSKRNKNNQLFINTSNSRAKLMILPANEELEIARQSHKLFLKHR